MFLAQQGLSRQLVGWRVRHPLALFLTFDEEVVYDNPKLQTQYGQTR